MGRPKIDIQEVERRIRERFPTETFSIIQYSSLGQPGVVRCETCKKEININKMNNFLAPTKAYGCVNCHGLWRGREIILEKIKGLYDIIALNIKFINWWCFKWDYFLIRNKILNMKK